MTNRKSLTATQLITELQKLPPETIITKTTWDGDWDHTTVWSFDSINENGELQYGEIINSWQGMYDTENPETLNIEKTGDNTQ